MDLSNLTPEQQQSFLSLLGQTNQQSMDPSSFGASQPPAPVPQQQEGDQMHPMDAIHQVGQQMFGPQAPAGIELTGGPQIRQGSGGSMTVGVPSDNPLLRLLGVKKNIDVTGLPNYYSAAKNGGLLDRLPSGLAQMPDGSPFVGKTAFTEALNAQKTLAGQGKEIYTSMDQLTSQGIPQDDARKLFAANPKGVTSKEVSNFMGSERLQDTHTLAGAKATMAGVARIGQALKVGGFYAADGMAEAANKNLGAVERVQRAIDQVMANGGNANEIQRSEIAAGLGILAGNGASQLTDQRMNQFLPETFKGKYGTFMEMLTNERKPVDFTGFLPQFQDLLLREKEANQGISDAHSLLGQNIMAASGQPNTARAIGAARAKTPIVGNPQNGPQVSPAPGNSTTKADPGTRYNQLRKSGLSKAQAYSLMHQEGY